MTENDLSRIYRQTSREEPTAETDAAILAAAHRAAKAKPRRLVTRSWGVPLSAAAVVVLSATLVLLALEEPEGQPARQPAAENGKDAPAARPDAAPAPPVATAPLERQSPQGSADLKREMPVGEPARKDSSTRFETRTRSAPAEEARSEAPESTSIEVENPKEWLAHIERLRGEGRIDEAKESLARFKKRYPDYALPDWANAE